MGIFSNIKEKFSKLIKNKQKLKLYGLIFIVSLIIYLLVFAPEVDVGVKIGGGTMKKVHFSKNLVTKTFQ